MGYRVTAPLVQAKKADGSYVHISEGGTLPEDIDEEQLTQLVDSKMVEADGDKPKRRAATPDSE